MNDGNKLPKLRFEGFSEVWTEKKLVEVYKTIRNAFVGTATPYYVKNGGYFYLESNNVKDGTINRNIEVFINEEFYLKQQDKWLYEGDLVMVQSGHVGHTAVIPKELDKISAHALIMFQNPILEIDPYFLNYEMQTGNAKSRLDFISTGNTIKHILASEMKEFIVYLPSYFEQTAIGNFFRNLDDTIALKKQQYEQTANIKKAMLEKMFPKKGADVPEVRFEGFSGAWEQKKVVDVCSISTGKSNTQDRTNEGVYPFYVRSSIVERSKRFLYDEEAVLTVGDGVGTGKVFHYVNEKYDLHQRVYRIFDFDNEVIGKYFYYYFSKHFYERVMSMTAKTSVDSVRLDMISDMEFVFPCRQEQEMITACYDTIDR